MRLRGGGACPGLPAAERAVLSTRTLGRRSVFGSHVGSQGAYLCPTADRATAWLRDRMNMSSPHGVFQSWRVELTSSFSIPSPTVPPVLWAGAGPPVPSFGGGCGLWDPQQALRCLVWQPGGSPPLPLAVSSTDTTGSLGHPAGWSPLLHWASPGAEGELLPPRQRGLLGGETWDKGGGRSHQKITSEKAPRRLLQRCTGPVLRGPEAQIGKGSAQSDRGVGVSPGLCPCGRQEPGKGKRGCGDKAYVQKVLWVRWVCGPG